MLDKYRETKRLWQKNNREKINEARKKLRLRKRLEHIGDKRCLLCEFPLKSKFAGCKVSRLYCNDCTTRNADGVRRHRWRRYWARKQGKSNISLKEQTTDMTRQARAVWREQWRIEYEHKKQRELMNNTV